MKQPLKYKIFNIFIPMTLLTYLFHIQTESVNTFPIRGFRFFYVIENIKAPKIPQRYEKRKKI